MKPVKSVIPLLLLLGYFFVFNSCKKESSATLSPQDRQSFFSITGKADAEASTLFDDIFDNSMGINSSVGLGGTGVFGNSYSPSYNGQITVQSTQRDNTNIPHCYTVTSSFPDSPALFPVRFTIDFGDSCTASDGRTRSGQIIAEYTGRLIVPGSKATISFQNYSVNKVHVEGSVIVENTSQQNGRSFRVQVTGGKLSFASGNQLLWNRDLTITQTAGLSTPLAAIDDEFSLEGAGSGSFQTANSFYQWSHKITTPLVKRFACHWIEAGSVNIQRGQQDAAVLDYGSGDCDNKATITTGGQVLEITLD